MKKYILILTIVAFAYASQAQQINNAFFNKVEKKNAVSFNFDLDPSLFWGFGYNRVFDLKIGNFERKLNTQIGLKTFQFNYADVNLGVNMFILKKESRFNILSNIGMEYKYNKNRVHKTSAFNGVVSIMPGYFAEKWYFGAEIMYKITIAENFVHTDYYKEMYPDVKDSWYKPELSYFSFSANTGIKIKNTVDINLRGGIRYMSDFKDYSPYIFPYFVDLTVAYRF